jgi:DNA-binding NarL/FixJ family response regulator
MIRVFIVEDLYYIRDSWKNLILRDPRTTLWGEAQGTDEALDMLETAIPPNRPDVILLDMLFRDRGSIKEKPKGLGTIQRILETTGLDTRVLCISNVIDLDIVVKAINQGAHGYVAKHQVEEGLVDVIEQVYNGAFVVSSAIAEIIIGVVNTVLSGPSVIFPDEKRISLTPRKEEIATLIFRYGMSAQLVADKLGIAKSTVDTHVKQIRKILGVVGHDDIVRAITARKSKQ